MAELNIIEFVFYKIVIPFFKLVYKILKFLVKLLIQGKITRAVAMNCEMVGTGRNGSISKVARVSLVNSYGEKIYDKYVKQTSPVTDYRTNVSGIRPHHIQNGEDYYKVRQEVGEILCGRVLIGHSIDTDLDALELQHPRKLSRDIQKFSMFRIPFGGRSPSLKNLAEMFLDREIQNGEHDSVENAKAAMDLYMKYRYEWENNSKRKGSAPTSAPRRVS